MQFHRDIGVFRRILGSLCDVDFIKSELRFSFARNVFESNGLMSQITQCEIVHVVSSRAVQHIGFQHGIKGNALHLNAVIGKNGDVVFDILPDFFYLRIFQ